MSVGGVDCFVVVFCLFFVSCVVCVYCVRSWCALRDRALFFPTTQTLERVFVLLKPEYTQPDYAAVLQVIEQNDFVVVGKMARVTTHTYTYNTFMYI